MRSVGSIGDIVPRALIFTAASLTLLASTALAQDGEFQEDRTTSLAHGVVIERLDASATVCDSYIVPPGGNAVSEVARGFFYLVALCYFFLGIALVSDMFMGAIEVITSKEKKVTKVDPATGVEEVLTYRVWNETVANLTLMALGSSAPEILLSVIETLQTLNSEPGELGPSTIIGSAAFNLLCITAVCTASVPDGEIRRVKELGVYTITSITSIFAYVWLLIVLRFSSENEVSIGEALITLAFFPILVLAAWLQDNRWFRSKGSSVGIMGSSHVVGASVHERNGGSGVGGGGGDGGGGADDADVDREVIGDKIKEVKRLREGGGGGVGRGGEKEAEENAVGEVSKALAHAQMPKTWSRAHYRSNAVRGFAGKARVIPSAAMRKKTDLISLQKEPTVAADGSALAAVLEFANPTYSVMENAGFVEIDVVCKWSTPAGGDADLHAFVEYGTADGTAEAGSDFIPCSGRLTFRRGEERKTISISIIDDNEYEDDEVFFVKLSSPGPGCAVGKTGIAAVTIIDDDVPGSITFTGRRRFVREADGEAVLTVMRVNGCSGEISCDYGTRDGTAKAGLDYLATSGTISFAHGETSKQIIVPILQDDEEETTETFAVELSAPRGGAQIGDVGAITVYIADDDGTGKLIDQAEKLAAAELRKFDLGTSSWGKQFRDAMTITGEFNEDGEYEEPSSFDYIMHFLTFFWKVLFAIVPPTDIWGGWAAFFGSLAIVGALTAIVGELAGLFGCVIGLKDPVTAITFVALGTSLPDTFASKQAVEQEEYADAAIGNVVGSNSVNVFLGLGLPWTIASIIKSSDEGTNYIVPAGSLAFSVTVFTALAVSALILLAVRRMTVGGELGGPGKWIVSVILASLWFIYIVVVSLENYGNVDGF